MNNATLQHFRFRTSDLTRTVSFYKHVFDMNIVSQEISERIESILLRPRYNDVGLRFEMTRQVIPQTTGDDLYDDVERKISKDKTSLTIYVGRLDDTLEKARDMDEHCIFVDKEENYGVHMAIVLDPEGYQLHLVEINEKLMPFTSAALESGKQVPSDHRNSEATGMRDNLVKIGYVTVPCPNMVENVRFYESIFSLVQEVQMPAYTSKTNTHSSKRSPKDNTTIESLDTSSRSIREVDIEDGNTDLLITGEVTPALKGPRKGFCEVDREEFPEQLLEYRWLANGERTLHASLCLVNHIDRRSQKRKSAFSDAHVALGEESEEEEPIFLGISLRVPDMTPVWSQFSHSNLKSIHVFKPLDSIPIVGDAFEILDPNEMAVEINGYSK
eukprot:GILK01007707.1.p1 GENE.GILK01007707.1~~GILK01007707.1.p1  ORF type:complete len:386 (+),score=58.66 GILK01007707.1:32-1189(+)